MLAALRKLFTRNNKPATLLDPRGPNKFSPGTTAPHPQYPAPDGETEYGTYQNPNKKKRK